MKNCLILGSGRSGTSMLGGIFHDAGYFLGDRLHKPRESNPKGFFEWYKINKINEELLTPYNRKNLFSHFTWTFHKKHTVSNPGNNQKWLMAIPTNTKISSSDSQLENEIQEVLKREPFCYKDPRFSYTLPIWQDNIMKYKTGETVFICIFREPDITVESILKECGSQEYLSSLHINRANAYRVWENMYSHILFNHTLWAKDLLFVHYNQIFNGTAIPKLSDVLEADLKVDFVDASLKRTRPSGSIPEKAAQIYNALCQMAGYNAN